MVDLILICQGTRLSIHDKVYEGSSAAAGGRAVRLPAGKFLSLAACMVDMYEV